MLRIKELQKYEKFDKGSYVKMTTFDKGRRIEVVNLKNRPRGIKSPLAYYRKINKKEYVDTRTGEVKKVRRTIYAKKLSVSPKLKQASRTVVSNFKGKKSEVLIELNFESENRDKKKVRKAVNDFYSKIEKILPPIIFIRVWLYPIENQPVVHLWLKTIDNSTLKLDKNKIEELWKDYGTVIVRELYKFKVEYIANYYNSKKYNIKVYPKYFRIWDCTKGDLIEKEIVEIVTREEADKRIIGYKLKSKPRTYMLLKKGSKEVQRISYENYIRVFKLKIEKENKRYIFKGGKINMKFIYNTEGKINLIRKARMTLGETREILEDNMWVTLDEEDYKQLYYSVGKHIADDEKVLLKMEEKYQKILQAELQKLDVKDKKE